MESLGEWRQKINAKRRLIDGLFLKKTVVMGREVRQDEKDGNKWVNDMCKCDRLI